MTSRSPFHAANIPAILLALAVLLILLAGAPTVLYAQSRDENGEPTFDEDPSATRTVAEDVAVGGNVGAPVTATDDDNDALTYTLSGDDAGLFSVESGTGQITVGAGTALDYETRTSYSVTVSVHDAKDANGNTDTTVDATIDVTLNIDNVDEPGTVTLSSTQPRVGAVLTARLTDPDGSVTNTGWQWASSPGGSTNWTDIGEATSATYTPVAADVNKHLRATASYNDGHGSGKRASAGPTTVTIAAAEALHTFIEEKVVKRYERSWPWLRTAWAHVNAVNARLVEAPAAGGYVDRTCTWWEGASGLRECALDALGTNRDISVAVHELGHVYAQVNRVASTPGPLAIPMVYFESLLAGSLDRTNCRAKEMYVAVMTLLVVDELSAGTATWWYCNGGNRARTQEAKIVVHSALLGVMPKWLDAAYGRPGGAYDLERLWSDIRAVGDSNDRTAMFFQLRNSFGGYCDARKASASMFGSGATRNPWRDGGCVPGAPRAPAATQGSGSLTVSWQPPASDGGSPIQGYNVQWRSGGGEGYTTARQARIEDPSRHSHTIGGLTNGIRHTARVRAWNHNGDGAASLETGGTPARRLTAELARSDHTATSHEGPGDRPQVIVSFNRPVEGFGATTPSVSVAGAGVDRVASHREEGLTHAWSFFLSPTGNDPIVFSLRAGRACESGGICTAEGGMLSEVPAAYVIPGPAAIVNVPATGRPAIVGTAQAGRVLSADTSGIADGNGLSKAVFHYQWISVEESTERDIQGATTAAYVLRPADTGSRIKVRATFTDDGGSREMLTSEETDPVTPAANAPTVTVSFGEDFYTAAEGGPAATVTIRLSADPERAVRIPLIATGEGGATAEDWTLAPRSVRFAAGERTKTVTVTATDDTAEEDRGESVRLNFGALPLKVRRGRTTATTVALADNDETGGICARTPAVRDRILFVLLHGPGYDDGCGRVTATELAKIRSLELSNRSIGALKPEDFSELSGLTELELDHNALRTLPAGLFDGLTALTELDLDHNALRTLPAGLFDGLTALTELDLSNNHLDTLPFAAVDSLSALTDLSLAGNPGYENGLEVAPVALALAPGESGEYRIRLTTRPRFRQATVTVTAESPGLTVEPATLTFTGRTWFRAQAVTVEVAGDAAVGRTVLSHAVTDYPGASVPGVTVTVTGTGTPLSTDATLGALALSGVTLRPAFSGATERYTARVAPAVRSVTVTAEPHDANASLTVNPAADADGETAGHQVALAAGDTAITITVTAEDGNTRKTYTVTVTRPEPELEPELALTAGASPVPEGTAAAFTLRRTGLPTQALRVAVRVTESGAMLSGPPPDSVTFEPGEREKPLTVATAGDRVVEAASTVTAAVVAGPGYRVAAGAGAATVSVVDDDVATFELSVDPATIREGAAATVTVAITNGVTFAGDQPIALTVAGGTAAAGPDYTGAPATLTLAAGRRAVTATITAVADAEAEPAETVVLAAAHAGTHIGTATVTLAASDAPAPLTGFTVFDNGNGGADVQALTEGTELAAGSSERLNIRAEVAAGATIGSVRLELNGAQPSARTENLVPYALFGDKGGQAFPAGTYRVSATAYPEDELGGPALQTLAVTFTVAASTPRPEPELTLVAGASPVPEGTAAAFTLRRTGPTPQALRVDVRVTESGAMLSGPPPDSVTFEPGEREKPLTVATAGDRVVEAASTVTAAVVAGPGYRVAAGAGAATVSVVDDDVATFELSVDPATIREGAAATVTVAITNGVTFAGDQPIALTVAGGTAAGPDYTGAPATLTLVAGRRAVTATITAVADAEAEPAETVVLAAAHAGTRIGTATVTLAASDAPAALTASVATAPATHSGSGPFTLRILFSEPVTSTPAAFKDHALEVTGGAVTGARQVDGRGDLWEITVTPDSTAAVVIALPAGRACDAPGAICTAAGQRLANRLEQRVGGPVGVTPLAGAFPGALYASALHKGPTDRPQVVVAFTEAVAHFAAATPSVAVTGAALVGVWPHHVEPDLANAYIFILQPVGQGPLVFNLLPGHACASGGICTPGGTVLSVVPPARVVPGPVAPAAPVITSPRAVTVDEGATTVATLTATDADTAADRLTWSIPSGSAGGADRRQFTLSAAGVLAFTAAKDFEAPDDVGRDRTYEVTVRVTDGANPVEAALTVRLRDVADETPPGLRRAEVHGATLVLTWTEALDGTSVPAPAAFTVFAGPPETRLTPAGVVVRGATATLTLDRAVAAGETVAVSYAVPARNPLRDAGRNRVAALVREPVTNHTPFSTDATLGALTLSGVTLRPAFSGATERYTARVAHAVRSVTVTAEPHDGKAGVAYDPVLDADAGMPGHQVALAAGDTAITITVTAADGRTRKTYTVTVTRAAAPAVTVSFGQAAYTATEGGAAAPVTVTLSADPVRAVTVALTAVGAGGATAGDWSLAPTSVAFSSGETSKTVTVTAVDDAVDDDGESVRLGFAGLPEGVSPGSRPTATVSLVDNDDPAVAAPSEDICGRTPAVRDGIMSMLRYLHHYHDGCAAVPAAELAKVEHLELFGSGIGALQPGDFAGLSGLTKLNLRNNALGSLPAGVFADLTALTELKLSGNRLRTLSAAVFDGLGSLTELNLRDNALDPIPFAAFEALPALTELGLYGNPGYRRGLEVSPQAVTVARGGRGEYRIRLTSSPTLGPAPGGGVGDRGEPGGDGHPRHGDLHRGELVSSAGGHGPGGRRRAGRRGAPESYGERLHRGVRADGDRHHRAGGRGAGRRGEAGRAGGDRGLGCAARGRRAVRRGRDDCCDGAVRRGGDGGHRGGNADNRPVSRRQAAAGGLCTRLRDACAGLRLPGGGGRRQGGAGARPLGESEAQRRDDPGRRGS